MKYLITGSHGWIGSALKRHLATKGVESVDYDLTKGNDLHNIEDLYRYIDKVDAVFHLAGEVGITRSWVNPTPFYLNNTVGSANLFRVARDLNKKVIYSSSGDVKMGNSPYAGSKIGAEVAGKVELLKGADIVFLRILSIYGEGQIDSYIIPKFIKMALNNEPITIHGTGEQKKDYIHIDDVVEAFWVAQDLPKGTITELGSGETTSVKEIAESAISITKSKSKLSFIPSPRPGEKLDMSGNMEHLYNVGWKSKISFNEGIRRIYEECKRSV